MRAAVNLLTYHNRRLLRAGAQTAVVLLLLLFAACSSSKRAAPAPTFTPAPSATGAGRRGAPPQHPVVNASCLRGLSSYRFSGTFSLRAPATPAAPGASDGEDGGLLSGSLANLLSNVTFQGSALAPDRYQAQVTFGGGGVQPLDVLRIGDQTFSRFGNAPWQRGDQISGLGGVSRFDPETLCQTVLVPVDAGGQTPARETVNGTPSLRYDVRGRQLDRLFGGGQGGGQGSGGHGVTPSPAATAASGTTGAQLTVWQAEQGGYPIRFQFAGGTANAIDLLVNVTDVNGKDVRIVPPA